MIAPSAFTSGIHPLATLQENLADRYYLYDAFSTTRAAGAVNGSLSEPIGGARTVVDANNKVTIAGGRINLATGMVSNSEGVWWSIQTRRLGSALVANVIPVNGVNGTYFGWDNAVNFSVYDTVAFRPSLLLTVGVAGGLLIPVGTYTSSGIYDVSLVMRASGMFYFIKGTEFTYWTMLLSSLVGTINLYPTLRPVAVSGAINAGNIRAPKQIYIPTPLQSDSMSGTTTDGLGNPEANSVTGTSYVDVGTWGVAGGKRSCSVLSSGLGFSYLPCSSSNVIIESVCTRTAGVTGLVARYADASNYLIAYLDGTNAKLDKVVAGITTNLFSGAVAYGATKVLSLHLDGTSARLFYGGGAVGTVATTPAAGSLNHGVYTTNIGATFDNLVIWPKGNEGQYEDMNLL